MTHETERGPGGSNLSAAINSGATALVQEEQAVKAMLARLSRLVQSLKEYSFPEAASALGELLTRPENHSANLRVEALIHLAALVCEGQHVPTGHRIQTWLDEMSNDRLVASEDPAEDVLVSRVFSDFGNDRVFMGRWNGNDTYLQSCLRVLNSLREVAPFGRTRGNVMALLRLSEAVAERAGAEPDTLSESVPGQALSVVSSDAEVLGCAVRFSEADLSSVGVSSADLGPFVLRPADLAGLKGETLGHTVLERRPLVRHRGDTIVALPTAIGAAIRRFVVEQAQEAGGLSRLQSELAKLQFSELYYVGSRGWGGMHPMELPEPAATGSFVDLVGSFDVGGFFHLLFVPDDLEEAVGAGLRGVQELGAVVTKRVAAQIATLADRADYRRGLTVLVHGGLGRGFCLPLEPLPEAWHVLALPLPDFMLLGFDSEMSLGRAWKLLEQERRLSRRGIVVVNGGWFPNLYGFAAASEFQLVPDGFDHGSLVLSTEYTAAVRQRLRRALDRHVALGPDNATWVEVQRESTTPFIDGQAHPIYMSTWHAAGGGVLVDVETSARPWWVQCDQLPGEPRWRQVALLLTEMARVWLLRLAPLLEERIPLLPEGPVAYALRFPGVEGVTEELLLAGGTWERPVVGADGDRKVTIDCGPAYLRSFVDRSNVGDRLMVAALARGAYLLGGVPLPEQEMLTELVDAVVGADEARFVHFPVARTSREQVEARGEFPSARMLAEEDLAWSRLGLANAVEREIQPGPLSEGEGSEFLHRAVEVVWDRIRTKLQALDRVSAVERALLNFGAICKERSDWRVASAALRATLGDAEMALAAWSKREREVHLAGMCCRVVAEMALCTCPTAGGADCGDLDLDALVADVAVLLECATYSDGIHRGVTNATPVIQQNGMVRFADGFDEAGSYFGRLREGFFREAVEEYGATADPFDDKGELPAEFAAAFEMEFGLSVDQYVRFLRLCAEAVLTKGKTGLWLPRSAVVQILGEAGAREPEHAFDAFVLSARSRWDENMPESAGEGDWHPWKNDRRLSILRRPLVEVDNAADPSVLVMPTLIENTADYLLQAVVGDRSTKLFDSEEMKSWIGDVVNRKGHEFNKTVGSRLQELGWQVEVELGLTQLRGGPELGDVDVLAWRTETGLVYVIECKRLRSARSVGELGRVLEVYGESGELKKHKTRLAWLKEHMDCLTAVTGLRAERVEMKSGLVTKRATPLQFFGRVRDTVDVVCAYEDLEREFSWR